MIVAVSTTLVGAGFKSGPYVKKIFATNNLKTLVAETQTIRNDIKQLDESMQMLVCESYNKVCRTVLPPRCRGRHSACDSDNTSTAAHRDNLLAKLNAPSILQL